MTTPAWVPTRAEIEGSNLSWLMRDLGFSTYEETHAWSVAERYEFWNWMRGRLSWGWGETRSDDPLDRYAPGENAVWQCGRAHRHDCAIVHRTEGGVLERWSHADLFRLRIRVAKGLHDLGLRQGDAVAVDLPMTAESVAIYLGIVHAGMVVVSIADSFAPVEIATRLRIAEAKAIFTGDVIRRGGKSLPLYEKVVSADAPLAIVLPAGEALSVELREGDLAWEAFLPEDGTQMLVAMSCERDATMNVLFSSGTTGDPKAIPWTHETPLKCAADAWLHHDVRPGDVVAWPTSLGWMMGPWLIFASLVNRASMALFVGAPTGRAFCEFVQDARVTMLGVVPSLVRAWRASGALDGLDWSAVRVLSSTGEASDPDDYRWLMERVGAPVIEYCGGTEIGGGYVTGTVLQPAIPGTFTTPAMGLDFVLLDEDGREADEGEVYLIPPSVGLSTRLLNRDHHQVYFEGVPPGPNGEVLRRHGDRMERLPNGYYRAQGRSDDTMNLGGIKVSSAEIERAVTGTAGVLETAAVAMRPEGGGPERLVVFAVPEPEATLDAEALAVGFRTAIRELLNPLFRVDEVRVIEALPRTASNKVMRRVLRDGLREGS